MNKSGGEEEEREMNGESSMEAYTLPYVKYIDSGNLLYDTGNANQGSVIAQRSGKWWEVGGSGREEAYVYL